MLELASLFGVSDTEVSEITSLLDASETGVLELASLFGVSETEVSEITSLVEASETGVLELASLFGASETEVSEITSLVDTSETGVLELSSLFGVSETEVSETGLLTGFGSGFVGETAETAPTIVALLSIVLLDKRISPLPLSPISKFLVITGSAKVFNSLLS